MLNTLLKLSWVRLSHSYSSSSSYGGWNKNYYGSFQQKLKDLAAVTTNMQLEYPTEDNTLKKKKKKVSLKIQVLPVPFQKKFRSLSPFIKK